MKINKLIFSSIRWNTFATIFTALMQTIQLFILTYLLNPIDFGLMAIVNICLSFIRLFADLGISSAVIHYPNISKKQFSTLFWLNIIVGILLCLIMGAFNPLIVYIYKDPALANLLLASSAILVISSIGAIYNTLFQKYLKFEILSKIEIISYAFGFLTTLLTAFAHFGVWSLIFGQIINSTIRSFSLFYYGSKEEKVELSFDLKIISNYLKFGVFQIGERSLNFLSERADQIILGYLLGMKELGLYNFSFNLVNQPLLLINPIFTKISFPLLSKTQNKRIISRKIYLNTLFIIVSIIMPLYIALLIFSPQLIPLLFALKWADSIFVIQILSIVFIFRGINNPTGSLILANGRADIGLKWNLFLFLLSTPLLYIMGKLFPSAHTIAFVLLGIQLLLFYPSYRFLIRPFIGKCFSTYIRNIFLIFLFSLFSIMLSILVEWLINSNIYSLTLKIIIFTITYSIIIITAWKTYKNETGGHGPKI